MEAQPHALRGGEARRVTDLEAVRFERGVQRDGVAGRFRFLTKDCHDGGVAFRPARLKARAEESVGRALVDDAVAVEPEAMTAAKSLGRCAVRDRENYFTRNFNSK